MPTANAGMTEERLQAANYFIPEKHAPVKSRPAGVKPRRQRGTE
jgi:hypothetical protein